MSTLSRRRPWLMFTGPEVDGGSDDSSLTPDQFLAKHGYPDATSTDDMTDEQKWKYWRRKSKGFQKDAETKDRELTQWKTLGEFDAVSTTVTTAEQARQAALTDAQRAQEAATRAEQEARTAGERAGASKYLGVAVKSSLVALTIRPGEKPEDADKRVHDALEFADMARFVDDKGELDATKVAQFAQSLGSATPAGDGGVLHTIMQRQSAPPAGSSGSVTSARERTRERLGKKKQ